VGAEHATPGQDRAIETRTSVVTRAKNGVVYVRHARGSELTGDDVRATLGATGEAGAGVPRPWPA